VELKLGLKRNLLSTGTNSGTGNGYNLILVIPIGPISAFWFTKNYLIFIELPITM